MSHTNYHVEILADSVSPSGSRLTTMQWTFPRFILAEVNTHRMLARCSASSRAIPTAKRIDAVTEHPFVPAAFSLNQRGMQASANLDTEEDQIAREEWLLMRDACAKGAARLAHLGTHKQHANRPIELWAWHTAIMSATDWDNLWAQRCHPDAQPEFRTIAEMAKKVYDDSIPRLLTYNEWHLPLVDFDDELELDKVSLPLVSAGRCARVSYLTHDGRRAPIEDMLLAGKIKDAHHMSPLEHPARPMTPQEIDWFAAYGPVLDGAGNIIDRRYIGSYLGPYNGWVQLRKLVPNEAVFQSRVP